MALFYLAKETREQNTDWLCFSLYKVLNITWRTYRLYRLFLEQHRIDCPKQK